VAKPPSPLICAARFFLWLALLMRRQPRTTLDGTILTLKLPLRHERSCDLAQVKSAQVTFGTASSETVGQDRSER